MSELMTLVDSTLELLEAIQRPLFIDTPEGHKRVAALQRKVAAYFRGLKKSFPLVRTAEIYKKHDKLREAASDIERELILVYNEWLEGEREALHNVLAESVKVSAEAGFTGELAEWIAKYELKAPVDVRPLIPKSLTEKLALRIEEVVVGVDKETAKQLAQVVTEGVKNQRGIPGITRDIHDRFDDMSLSRAKAIARTETNELFSMGSRAAADVVGSTEKEWIKRSGYPCDICDGNADVGRIPIDEEFPSGHDHTSGHTHCTCDVAYYGATRTGVERAIA